MRSMYKVALAACALALAVCAVGAASAFAAETPEWYGSPTKPAPEWQQAKAKVTVAAATKSKGKIKLYDLDLSVEVECEAIGEGTVGPGAVGKTTGWTLSGCVPTSKARNKKGEEKVNACTKIRSVTMVGAPWRTELTISGGSLRDVIVGEGSAKPGFTIECVVAGIEQTDKCTAEKLNTTVADATGGVNATFGEEKLKCTLGGAEAGMIEGTQLIEATKGAALEANVVEGTYSKLTSSVAVKSTGELEIEDRGDALAAKCNFTLGGSVGAGAKGTITSVEAGECQEPKTMKNYKGEEVENTCGRVDSIASVDTPWDTELYESGGVILNRIVSGGSGTPALHFVCSVGGVEKPDQCNLSVSPEILNASLEGDAIAEFNPFTAIAKCSSTGREEGVWSGELKIAPTTGAIKAKG